jgi:glycosyltransferase involved in cell wall biosynthesis
MACGAPVLTSANSSLAEIADCAAELVDPTSVESIAEGLRRLLTDPARRADLRARGLARAAQFTWNDAAHRTRAVYREAAKGLRG